MPGASKRRGKSDKQNRGADDQAPPATSSAPAGYDGPQDNPSPAGAGGRGRGGGRGGGRGSGRGGAPGGGRGAPNAPENPTSTVPSVRSQSPVPTQQPIARDPARDPPKMLNRNVDFPGNAYNLFSQVSNSHGSFHVLYIK